MTYIKTRDGTDLFVKSWGEGRPVILTHGRPLAADMWDAQSMALAKAGYRAGHTNFRPDLPAFRVPTLIIHGTADKTVPIDAAARAAARAIPSAQLIEYEDEPHGLNATAGDRLTRELLTFVGA